MWSKSIAIIVLMALLISLMPSPGFAQEKPLQDVVYLKNGSIIRGTIVEQMPGQTIKIRTADGSVFVYQMSEIERLTKEEPITQMSSIPTKSKKEPVLSCVLSILLPGLGQFYNGEAGKGAIMLGASVLGVVLMAAAVGDAITSWDNNSNDSHPEAAIGAMIIFGSWLWSVVDAPISSSRINRKNGWTSLDLIDDDLAVRFDDLSVEGKMTPGIRLKWSF